jgi:hypothetical protein
MHNTYGGHVGERAGQSTTKMKFYVRNIFVCSGERHWKNEASQKDITRTGCDARVQFSINKENVCTVQKIVVEHNHYPASLNKTHKLMSE